MYSESTVVRAASGSIAAEGGRLKIKAGNGTVLAGTELSFRVDDSVFPIAAQVTERTATIDSGLRPPACPIPPRGAAV